MTKVIGAGIKNKALALRKKGYSLEEISKIFNIAKSTASLWFKDINLNNYARKRLEKRSIDARLKGANTMKQQHLFRIRRIQIDASNFIGLFNFKDRNITKLLCSLLYWGEGGKVDNNASFINSDYKMIKTYMILFRNSFDVHEEKFRALVHIHEYHNDNKIKLYWSKITNIPIHQFTKSYQKPHTGKIIHTGYMGTIKIKYYDVQIANELKAIYNTLADKLGL